MAGIDFIQDLAVILVVAGVVGWVCQRVGLSAVVGFLLAGILVGPHMGPFTLVSDLGRVDTAAQVGLVFLMFGIGLRLSLRKLRKLGLSLLLAVAASAGVIFYLTRLLGVALGLGEMESVFLAGMLMVSSSAIIGKVLQETGSTHERSGQLAMGVTVLEDVVAVVMLTVLNSIIQFGGVGGGPRITETIGMFGVFVVMAAVLGLLLVPWLLRRMSIAADEELQTLGMAALLFGLAIVAQRAGYSLALGAFLLGTIVSETPHRHQIDRTFEGMRDVFSAVFFVAIGMQIDLRLLGEAWGLVLAVGGFTLVARVVAASVGLVLIGNSPKDAFRAGLALTPIGEFSFIIAQLGVTAQVVPAKFYPLAVGVSLLTTLVAPLLTRRSEAIASWVFRREPRWARVWTDYYRSWLERLQARQKRNLLWQLSRKRFIQISVEAMLVTGLLVFSPQMLVLLEGALGRDWLFPRGPAVLFWSLLALIVLAPLVAIWRNTAALALLYAQVSTSGNPRQRRLAPLIEGAIKTMAGATIYIWLSSFMPAGGSARWLLLATALVVVVALLMLRRKLIFWHSELEVELQDVLGGGESRMAGTSTPWLQSHASWNLQVIDCVLPDLADCQGQRIAELELRSRFGCTVVGIERQGFMIPLPGPEAVLYPRDRVMLMGTGGQVKEGKRFLTAVTGRFAEASDFDEVSMEAVSVPIGSPLAGKTLGELSLARTHGVQVAGIDRGGRRLLNPGPDERLEARDELLLLGTPAQIGDFKVWLKE
jgi:CPA2 family monovalent cation:H+ antiporter-2